MNPAISTQIGDCRLILADSLDIMPDIRDVDLIVSDVPYKLTSGGQTEGGLHERFGKDERTAYTNDGNLFQGEVPAWEDFMPMLYDCLKEDAHCYTMSDSKNIQAMLNAGEAAGFRFHNMLYWDKGTCTPNRWYMKNAEFVALHYKGKAFSINNCSSKQGIYVAHQDESAHPTEKPVLLMQHYITNSSQPGELVLDPFMGTGTTGIAAIRSGRKFIGIERDPQWYEVACKRIEQEMADRSKQTMDLFAA
jgi:DNA modification methylase